jgi:hypothetical protein
MSVDIEHMEHRWGVRVDLDVPTLIRTDAGFSAEGFIRNASISGAFVETETHLPLLSCLSLRPGSRAGEWLDACVVRVEDHGIALEWLDPGSRLVPELIAMRRNSRGEVLQTAPERMFTVHAAGRT